MSEEPTPKKHSRHNSGEGDQLRKLGLFTVIVSDLIGYTGAGIGLGYLAWAKWHAPWWVMVATSIAGLSLAMYRMYQISQKEL